MGNKFSRTPREPAISPPSPTMENTLFGVHIARLVRKSYDRILKKRRKRKHWSSSVRLDLAFRTSDPQTLVSATARPLADSDTPKDVLRELNRSDLSACCQSDWTVLWDWIEERYTQVPDEFERFKLDLATMINRGQLTIGIDTILEGPPAGSPSQDLEMRVLRFEIRFHNLDNE